MSKVGYLSRNIDLNRFLLLELLEKVIGISCPDTMRYHLLSEPNKKIQSLVLLRFKFSYFWILLLNPLNSANLNLLSGK